MTRMKTLLSMCGRSEWMLVCVNGEALIDNFFFSLCCQIFVFMYDLFIYYVDY